MMLLNKLKKFFYQKILKRKYYRTGSCKKCGRCCCNIYIRHSNKVISTEEEFNSIKAYDTYSFYKHITPIDKDEFGLIFSCDWFDKEKKLCTNHKKRPSICRNYPSEEIFSFGAILEKNCGYAFIPIESFQEVFSKISKKAPKEFETLN